MAYSTAAVAAAMANAVKASGAIVQVEPDIFSSILSRNKGALVVTASGGLFKRNYQYLTAYKGLVFFTKSPTEMILSGNVEVFAAKQIWIPG